MKETVKVALIGCGGIAFGKHLPALAALENVQITAFCDIIEERAQKAAKQYGIPEAKIFTDYRRLLAEADAAVVHVCTPNRSHSPITVAALESGRHVLCEKPMAINAEQAQAMLEAAKRTGKKLSIAYQNRHRPDAWFLKQACANGDLGEIYYAKAHALRRRAVPTWGVFLNEYEQGGGPLIDIGTHALDLTLWMMDNYRPRMVVGTAYKKLGNQQNAGNAWGDWNPEQFTVEDAAFGFIVMENGATIVLESSWALNTLDIDEAKTSLCGTKAGADMRDGLRINGVQYGKQYVLKPGLDAQGVAFFDAAGTDPAELEAKRWIDAVVQDTQPVVKPEQALVVTQILDAIYESARTGKPVYLGAE